MKIIDQTRLDRLSRDAAATARRRMNLNLHDDYTDPCQRLFNAMEPGTYIRPHRHLDPPKPECFMAIRGRMALITFADDGTIEAIVRFATRGAIAAIEIPPGIWHTLVSLESGSIFFETKPGPYVPLSDKDFAPWSPTEGCPEAALYLQELIVRISNHE
ncbi:MAG: WbuC family cupin fold metalloprotein [Desulfuromonadales bacterium]